jgi:hypothetical protein
VLESVDHRLAAALRFVDAFTGKAIGVPLDVRAEALPVVKGMPQLPWRAIPGPNDGTYRFFVTNATVMPVGPVPVTVTAPRHEYVDFEGLAVVLPRPLVAHPPSPARSDYLVEKALWPTRVLKVSPGETALVAHVKSAGANPVANLRIKIWAGLGPPPASPYAYTDAAGDVLFRLPDLKTVVGGVISTTVNLNLEIRVPPLYAVTVAPTQIRTDTGAVLPLPMNVRLAQVTTLEISIP